MIRTAAIGLGALAAWAWWRGHRDPRRWAEAAVEGAARLDQELREALNAGRRARTDALGELEEEIVRAKSVSGS